MTTCVFDTNSRNVPTMGGYGFTEEMCLNYVHYYPKVELEICKSSVDSDALDEYFKFADEYVSN